MSQIVSILDVFGDGTNLTLVFEYMPWDLAEVCERACTLINKQLYHD